MPAKALGGVEIYAGGGHTSKYVCLLNLSGYSMLVLPDRLTPLRDPFQIVSASPAGPGRGSKRRFDKETAACLAAWCSQNFCYGVFSAFSCSLFLSHCLFCFFLFAQNDFYFVSLTQCCSIFGFSVCEPQLYLCYNDLIANQ